MLRFHGSRDKKTFEQIGCNSRLDALQAAVLRVQLPHLDGWADGRRAAAGHYQRLGLGELVTLPQVGNGGGIGSARGTESEPAWHLYVVRTETPEKLGADLAARGIGARDYYRTPVHEQPAMREFAPTRLLPGTEIAAGTNLAIPISPVLDEEQAREVVDAVRASSATPVGSCARG
jgi:dTDP-4-amino-4,6-dideoxygalactose transaminase